MDAGAAMMNCMLLIEEIGLKSGFLGSHNMKSAEIKSLMKIPESYQLLGFVTAGIEGKASSIKKNVPKKKITHYEYFNNCLLYTSPSPRDVEESRMPSSA